MESGGERARQRRWRHPFKPRSPVPEHLPGSPCPPAPSLPCPQRKGTEELAIAASRRGSGRGFGCRGCSVTAAGQGHQVTQAVGPRASARHAAPRMVAVMSRGTGRPCGGSFRDGAIGARHPGTTARAGAGVGDGRPPAHPAPARSPETGSGHRWPRSPHRRPPPRSAPVGKHRASCVTMGGLRSTEGLGDAVGQGDTAGSTQLP